MSAYHQMGHDSRNLLLEGELSMFRGAILSPVNEDENGIQSLSSAGLPDGFELVFDPQLYFPHSERRLLRAWSYFPTDVDSADLSSLDWWNQLVRRLVECVRRFDPHCVCSPGIVPRTYSDEYYELNRETFAALADELGSTGIQPIQTLIVRIEDLSDPVKCGEIASIATSCTCARIYLVIVSDIHPRREMNDTDGLIGAINLIRYLEAAGTNVVVGFTSSDVILWKAAGATDCATGKFFNLRRFTRSRFDEPGEGGGQLPYWFEGSLMAYLRESDLVRVRDAGLLSQESMSNPYGQLILDRLRDSRGTSWLGLSWRQYLFWFAQHEARLSADQALPQTLLRLAEEAWDQTEARQILMEERQNNGAWLRSWRRALIESTQANS